MKKCVIVLKMGKKKESVNHIYNAKNFFAGSKPAGLKFNDVNS